MTLFYAFCAGIFSGVLNTLASSGSAVTLPALVFLGLHPSQANATNRLGIIFGAFTSVSIFHRKGLLQWRVALPLTAILTIGAAAGAILATQISERATHWTINLAVAMAFVLILLGSKRFLKEVDGPPRYRCLWIFAETGQKARAPGGC